jgi:hypothetical protein
MHPSQSVPIFLVYIITWTWTLCKWNHFEVNKLLVYNNNTQVSFTLPPPHTHTQNHVEVNKLLVYNNTQVSFTLPPPHTRMCMGCTTRTVCISVHLYVVGSSIEGFYLFDTFLSKRGNLMYYSINTCLRTIPKIDFQTEFVLGLHPIHAHIHASVHTDKRHSLAHVKVVAFIHQMVVLQGNRCWYSTRFLPQK